MIARSAVSPRMRHPRLSVTLSAYITRQFLVWFGGLMFTLAAVILLVSIVDLLDRLATKEDATLLMVVEMALLRLPFFSQEIMPFTILGASMFTFWKLTRTHELVVARAAGVSVWQFLLPAVSTGLTIGLLAIGLLNPLGATLLARYDALEARYMRNATSLLQISNAGLWLRQPDEDGGQSVIHARRVAESQLRLADVIVFRYDGADEFRSRIDAEGAVLTPGAWRLEQARVSQPGTPSKLVATLDLPTKLTPEKILDSFAPPESLSFWALPGFIDLLISAGFAARPHELYFQKLLATPLLFAGMVLLAASFSLRPPRRGRVGLVVLTGAMASFLLYFLSNFVFAFGISGKIPVLLAAWTPTAVVTMLGAAILFHLEDG